MKKQHERELLFVVSIIALSIAMCSTVFGADSNIPEGSEDANGVDGVNISLTGFGVTPQALELTYVIRNDSDQDVWVCDKVISSYPDSRPDVLLGDDEQTIYIRRRIDVPLCVFFEGPVYTGYARLRAGMKRTESLSFPLPLNRFSVFGGDSPKSPSVVRRIIIEIGYYKEDLPKTMEGILDVAVEFGRLINDSDDRVLIKRFFPGLFLRAWSFSDSVYYYDNKDGVYIPYTDSPTLFRDERTLQITVEGTNIPSEFSPKEDKISIEVRVE